ncbi:MAG: hypothetical protein AAF745_05855 [Planctomycetota bacterium]
MSSQSMTIDDPKPVSSERLAKDSAEKNLEMIRCLPRGICSWHFVLHGENLQAILQLGALSEQGLITMDGTNFEVQKHGIFSGRWTLNHEGQEVASAQKSTAFTRTFAIQDPSGELVLRAESSFGRSFRLERSNDVIATMRPDHPLTRRATIEILTEQWDLPTVSFSFWLVVLMWRRAAQSNSG